MEEKMENEMATGVIQGILGINVSHMVTGHGFLGGNVFGTILNHQWHVYVHP